MTYYCRYNNVFFPHCFQAFGASRDPLLTLCVTREGRPKFNIAWPAEGMGENRVSFDRDKCPNT